MAVLDDLTQSLGSSWASKVLIGTAAILVAPIVAPAAFALLRPLAKTVIKGGVIVYDTASDMVAEASEQLADLIAEARVDLAASATAGSARQSAEASRGAAPPPPGRAGERATQD